MCRDRRCRAQLEHVAMADEVGLHVGCRVLDAVADAGLGAEVDDAVEARCASARRFSAVGIGEIDPLEAEAIAELAREAVEPRPLQRGIVIIVEIVDPDDLVAALEQGARGGRADEARSPCDQNSHGRAHRGCSRRSVKEP